MFLGITNAVYFFYWQTEYLTCPVRSHRQGALKFNLVIRYTASLNSIISYYLI